MIRSTPQARLPIAFVAAGQVFGVIMCMDRLVHGGTAGLVASVAGVLAVVSYFSFSLAVLRARRPWDYRDGIIDGFAAAAGLLVLQWQYAALQPGATAATAAAGLTPFLAAFYCLTMIVMQYGITRDPSQNKVPPLAMIGVSILLALANIGHASYTLADAPRWALGLPLVACFLITGIIAHPDLGRMYRPEPPRRRLVQMRWVGPVGCLVAPPAMLMLAVLAGVSPLLPATVAGAVLTGVALWRGTKMLRERERSRRDLRAEQRFRSLLEHAADAIVILDAELRVTYAGGDLRRVVGGDGGVADVEGVLVGQHAPLIIDTASGLTAGATVRVPEDVPLRADDGGICWVTISVTHHLATPGISGWVLNLRDVTARKAAEAAMARLALEDAVTGLPNRASMRARLESAMTGSAGGAVLFCDLDGFKMVNDRLGHDSGDEVLRAVAGRWSAVLRADDVLGRWGGDEFLVICSRVPGISEVEKVAARLVAALEAPVAVGADAARIGVSIGLAVQGEGDTADELLCRADAAMYAAKRASGGVRTA